MTFWAFMAAAVVAVWIFMICLAVFGAGIPLLRAKRKERRGRE